MILIKFFLEGGGCENSEMHAHKHLFEALGS